MTVPKRNVSLEQADLLLSALPDLARPVWRSFAPPYRVYLQQEARMKTGLKRSQLLSAEMAGHLTVTELPSAGKRNINYKADEIDHLRTLCEQTKPITQVASTWKLPIYAVEQFASKKVLEHADEPILAATHALPRMRQESIERLSAHLLDGRSRSSAPTNARSLSKTIRMHGGAEKPWAAAFEALLRSDIPWWIDGSNIDASTILVLPEDVREFGVRDIERDRIDALNWQLISKRDASEILNATPAQFQCIDQEHTFSFTRVSKADLTSKTNILALARDYICAAEIDERLKGLGRKIEWIRKLDNLDSSSLGWPREETVRRLDIL